MSFSLPDCCHTFAPMQTLNITLPTSWHDLTDNQLHLVCTFFPSLRLCHCLAIRVHIWDSYQQLHARQIRNESIIVDTYFSYAQMQSFRQTVLTQYRTSSPLEEQVIKSLQSYELQLLTDTQVHPQCYYDLVNIIRQHPDEFPAWHNSDVAQLYTPKIFQNKKNPPLIGSNKEICIFAYNIILS